MVQEAEEFSDEDKKVREKIEARNALENYVYSMKNTLSQQDLATRRASPTRSRRRRQGGDREGARGGERVARRQPGGREGRTSTRSSRRCRTRSPIISKVYRESGGAAPGGGDFGTAATTTSTATRRLGGARALGLRVALRAPLDAAPRLRRVVVVVAVVAQRGHERRPVREILVERRRRRRGCRRWWPWRWRRRRRRRQLARRRRDKPREPDVGRDAHLLDGRRRNVQQLLAVVLHLSSADGDGDLVTDSERAVQRRDDVLVEQPAQRFRLEEHARLAAVGEPHRHENGVFATESLAAIVTIKGSFAPTILYAIRMTRRRQT